MLSIAIYSKEDRNKTVRRHQMLNEVTEFTFKNDGAWGAKNYFYRCVYNNISYRGTVWVGANGATLASVIHENTNRRLGRTHRAGANVEEAMIAYAKEASGFFETV